MVGSATAMDLPNWWRRHRGRLLLLWGVGLAASIAVTTASAWGYLATFQASAMDFLQVLSPQREAPEVVIVAIDEAAFAELGSRQPVSRAYLARLVRGLQRSGARIVGLDLLIDEPTEGAEDEALARAILDFEGDGISRVVMASSGARAFGPFATPAFERRVLRGSAKVPRDEEDRVIRHAEFLLHESRGTAGAGRPAPAFSLAVAARLGGLGPEAIESALGATGGPLPLPAWRPGTLEFAGGPPVVVRKAESVRINFVGPERSFLTVPSDVVAALADPSVALTRGPNPFRDRVVLIGETFGASRDFYQTPYGTMPGVEIHANLVHMLLTRTFLVPVSWVWSFAVQVLFVLVGGVIMVLVKPWLASVTCIGGALLLGVPASYLAFQRGGHFVEFALPVMVIDVMNFGANVLAARRRPDSLRAFLSPRIARRVLADGAVPRGRGRPVSILVAHLPGFAALVDGLPSSRVLARVDEYFEAMTTAIVDERGTVHDFSGDGIRAVFGAAGGEREHALQAVRAGLAMRRAFEALGQRWERLGVSPLWMSIGIHTDEAVAGMPGGGRPIEYLLLGEAASLCARVERVGRRLGATILITAETRAQLGNRVEVKPLGELALRGGATMVGVFEVIGTDSSRAGSV